MRIVCMQSGVRYFLAISKSENLLGGFALYRMQYRKRMSGRRFALLENGSDESSSRQCLSRKNSSRCSLQKLIQTCSRFQQEGAAGYFFVLNMDPLQVLLRSSESLRPDRNAAARAFGLSVIGREVGNLMIYDMRGPMHCSILVDSRAFRHSQ
jgi:hypothetical protein